MNTALSGGRRGSYARAARAPGVRGAHADDHEGTVIRRRGMRSLLGFALILLTGCAGVREPLAIVHVGNFGMRLRPEYRFDGGDGPSLALYPDGRFLRERLVDGKVKVVQGRISRRAAARMIAGVTRCMKPVAEVTEVVPASIRFHPLSMMLVFRLAEKRPIVRVVVDVAATRGQIVIRDSAEHLAAVFGDADSVDLGDGFRLGRPPAPTPEPDFWPCLRPLLYIASNDEVPWTPSTIEVVLAGPRTGWRRTSKWPEGLPLPPRPRKVRDDTSIRYSVPYRHIDALRELLTKGEYVELYGYLWTVDDLWLPWPGQTR